MIGNHKVGLENVKEVIRTLYHYYGKLEINLDTKKLFVNYFLKPEKLIVSILL